MTNQQPMNKMTNFERIKQLDIQEMCDFLMYHRVWCACIYEQGGSCEGTGKVCEKGVIEWLRSEFKDDQL